MDRKLRHSRQRDRIYEYLKQAEGHPSAETIYADLRPESPELSLGTVYRNLKLLEELGKVRRVVSFRGTERYDACCGDHAHFLCAKCGLLMDLGDSHIQTLRSILVLDPDYSISKLDLTVTGVCPNCAE